MTFAGSSSRSFTGAGGGGSGGVSPGQAASSPTKEQRERLRRDFSAAATLAERYLPLLRRLLNVQDSSADGSFGAFSSPLSPSLSPSAAASSLSTSSVQRAAAAATATASAEAAGAAAAGAGGVSRTRPCAGTTGGGWTRRSSSRSCALTRAPLLRNCSRRRGSTTRDRRPRPCPSEHDLQHRRLRSAIRKLRR